MNFMLKSWVENGSKNGFWVEHLDPLSVLSMSNTERNKESVTLTRRRLHSLKPSLDFR